MSYISESCISDSQPTPPDHTSDKLRCRTAQFGLDWPHPSTALVTADGELDATNGDQLVDFALRNCAHADRLVIDLSGLSFFATAGFTALHTLNVQCAGEEIRWAVVGSPAVDRLLRICDPDAVLPICTDVADALTTVHTEPPRLLQLVPESR